MSRTPGCVEVTDNAGTVLGYRPLRYNRLTEDERQEDKDDPISLGRGIRADRDLFPTLKKAQTSGDSWELLHGSSDNMKFNNREGLQTLLRQKMCQLRAKLDALPTGWQVRPANQGDQHDLECMFFNQYEDDNDHLEVPLYLRRAGLTPWLQNVYNATDTWYTYVLVDEADTIWGVIVLVNQHGNNPLFVHNVLIEDRQRGRGLGYLLFVETDAIISGLPGLQDKDIELEVDVKKMAAVGLYIKLGYEVIWHSVQRGVFRMRFKRFD